MAASYSLLGYLISPAHPEIRRQSFSHLVRAEHELAVSRSFRQLGRFHHVINSDKVFGTHTRQDRTHRVLKRSIIGIGGLDTSACQADRSLTNSPVSKRCSSFTPASRTRSGSLNMRERGSGRKRRLLRRQRLGRTRLSYTVDRSTRPVGAVRERPRGCDPKAPGRRPRAPISSRQPS